jgi:hypothetical protein
MRAAIEYLVEIDGHSHYLPTLLRLAVLRSRCWRAERNYHRRNERAAFGPPFLYR